MSSSSDGKAGVLPAVRRLFSGHSDRSSTISARSERYFTALILCSGIAVFGMNLWRNRFFLHDDAFISLKYARNLVESGELSWNLGDRVEGYTNFLYVLMTAAFIDLGFDPVMALRVINGIAIALMVAAVVYGARAVFPDRKDLHALAVTLVLANVSVAVWIYGGLEAPVAAAFIAWGMGFMVAGMAADTEARQVKLLILAGISLALAVLTRPDGVIVVAFAAIAYLFTSSGSWQRRLGRAAIIAGIPFVIFMVHMAWRISYYGDVVPNTFHAKVGLELGHRLGKVVDYFVKSSLLYLPLISCASVAVASALFWGRITRIGATLLAVCMGFALYVAWSGGDHMAAARVLLPIAGPATLLAVVALSGLPKAQGRVVIVIMLGMLFIATFKARSFRMDWAAFNGTVVGQYIEEAWPADSLVALNTAGSTPYFGASHRYIDMLGLNDRTIALREDVPVLARRQAMPGHGKGDGAYVLSRQPDYIVLGGAEGIDAADADKWFLTGVELSQIEQFSECYHKNSVVLEVPETLKRFRPNQETLRFTYYENLCGE
ncbi:ArnT family glycosyltransferase [Yoonia maritima]|uniref:ArnT family glycosyltransferase n=1 Tax=Yoonia maritima TaxID=1435347 RepID=UPI003735CF09